MVNREIKTMVLGGFQENSLIDYPGKISCMFFLSGCNFNCPYCHNPDLVKGGLSNISLIDEEAVCAFLERRRGLLDGVVISGGEPTIHQDIVSLCEKIKLTGYPIKLDTNGSRPLVIRKLINERFIDYVAMDIKANPLSYPPSIKENYNPTNILLSIQIIMESALAYEFRTTCVKPIVDKQVIENIARTIEGATLYVLQDFDNSRILHPEFFEGLKARYDENELLELKSIAEPWVKKCEVR